MPKPDLDLALDLAGTDDGYWGGYYNGLLGRSWTHEYIENALRGICDADLWWQGYQDGLHDKELTDEQWNN